MASVFQEVYVFIMQMWMELFFVFCFGVAFSLLRVAASKRGKSVSKISPTFKSVHVEASRGNAAAAVAAWRARKSKAASPVDTLKVVTQAFLEAEPSYLVSEILEHIRRHSTQFLDGKATTAALEVVAQAGKVEMMEHLAHGFVRELQIEVTPSIREALLCGYAAAGNEDMVKQTLAQIHEHRQKITLRGYSLLVKGLLKNGMLDAAIQQIKAMRSQNLSVPSFAVTELFRAARDAGRAEDVLNSIHGVIPLTSDALGAVAEACLRSQDVALAKKAEKLARGMKVQFNFNAYEALLKLYTTACDLHALELFEDMQGNCKFISDGLCVALIARCADSKFVRLAEAVIAYVRLHSKMSIPMYSALMKVYAHARRYEEACDLYDQILADGLEPDSMMYGCLMKFSASCGRSDLTQQLSSKMASSCDNYQQMALIRAAGQLKDVDKAFAVFEQIKASGIQLDSVLYNSILDVCSITGNLKRAQSLAGEMRKLGLMDIVSYNTLLKGCCTQSDVSGAKAVLAEMEEAGYQPNDVSYNSLINVAASVGNFQVAWETVQTMERKGVKLDHFTVSTMLKALKNTKTHTSKDDLYKVMDLMDRHSIDVCCEEVLLNTSIEACIKYHDHRRLAAVLASCESRKGGMHLAAHTYGALIRASGILKRIHKCREIWVEMTEQHKLAPSEITLGCMLEALVSHGASTEALALCRKWQKDDGANTVLYSTLIKGCVSNQDTEGAEALWLELREKKLPLNTLVYNAILDAYAKAGSMNKACALVESMGAEGCKPDDITWSMVAKGYCVNGDLDKALDVFKRLHFENRTNTTIAYNTILDGCVKHNRFDLADIMLGSLESWKIYPTNFTLGIVVKLWGRRRQLSKAFAAVKTLPQQYGFTPNGPVLTSLLFACLRNDALSDALAAYQDLRRAGIPTDGKVFSALIGSCARAGRSEQAVSLVEEAYGLGGKARRVLPAGENIDTASLEQVLKMLQKQGLMQKHGIPLLQDMRVAKVSVNSRILNTFLDHGGHQ